LRKQLLRFLSLFFLPIIASVLIRFLYHTNRKKFHLPAALPNEPVIIVFWHGNLLMQAYIYYQLRKKGHPIKLMISEHFDGKIIAKTMHYFQFDAVHGSTTRNAAKVLIRALRSLKAGEDVGITPDGPKGPRHSVSDGVVVMAQKTGAKVVAVHCIPTKYWEIKSWDRFTIPKPFGVLDYYASEPFSLEGMEFEAARALVKAKLLKHEVPLKEPL